MTVQDFFYKGDVRIISIPKRELSPASIYPELIGRIGRVIRMSGNKVGIMMDSMRKPQTDKVARGPGTGESMAVRDFIQGLPDHPGAFFVIWARNSNTLNVFHIYVYVHRCAALRYIL